ncbi:primosomal protein N', partial [Vibrio parahaemolyticus AQ3810]
RFAATIVARSNQ